MFTNYDLMGISVNFAKAAVETSPALLQSSSMSRTLLSAWPEADRSDFLFGLMRGTRQSNILARLEDKSTKPNILARLEHSRRPVQQAKPMWS